MCVRESVYVNKGNMCEYTKCVLIQNMELCNVKSRYKIWNFDRAAIAAATTSLVDEAFGSSGVASATSTDKSKTTVLFPAGNYKEATTPVEF